MRLVNVKSNHTQGWFIQGKNINGQDGQDRTAKKSLKNSPKYIKS